MGRLLVLLSIFFPISWGISHYERVHYSEVTKIKCDAMPYRTAYYQAQCYFVHTDLLRVNEANSACSRVFSASSHAISVDSDIWDALGVDSTLYHVNAMSAGEKKVVCVYGTQYNCESDTASAIPGKCLVKGETKMTYDQAVNFCAKRFADLPNVTNDAENQIVAAESNGSPLFVNIGYNKQWSDPTRSFGRFAFCKSENAKDLLLGPETTQWCPIDANVVVGPDGYWSLSTKDTKRDVLCVRNAQNEFYTEPVETPPEEGPTSPRPTQPPVATDCAEEHKFNKETGKCEWTGVSSGCVRLENDKGQRMFVTAINRTADLNLATKEPKEPVFDEITVKAIVRNGCFATFYDQPQGGKVMLDNKGYGSYVIPSTANKLVTKLEDGLSRVVCNCPPPPCEPLHTMNAKTGQCEWTGPSNGCVRLENDLGQTRVLLIPNFPKNRKLDIGLWSKVKPVEEFNDVTVKAVVRNGCKAHFYDGNVGSKPMLFGKGYGTWIVPSSRNGMLKAQRDGLSQVICSCPDPNEKCPALHKMNAATNKCEWTGPSNDCVQLENYLTQTMVVQITNYPINRVQTIGLWSKNPKPQEFNDVTVEATVRTGCTATFTDGHKNSTPMLENKGFGTYTIASVMNGRLTKIGDGLSGVVCRCLTLPCEPLHKLNEKSGRCEWVGDSNGCVRLENDQGQTRLLSIANYPTNRKLDVGLWSKVKPAVEFNDVTVKAVVRAGCEAHFFDGHRATLAQTKPMLFGKTYGTWTIPSFKNGLRKALGDGLSRVICTCPDLTLPCRPAHKMNTATGLCEWTGPSNGCVLLENYLMQTSFVQISNFPKNRVQTVGLWSKKPKAEEFNDVTVKATVRIGCAATFTNGYKNSTPMINNRGYGTYVVPSYMNGLLPSLSPGLSGVSCRCPKPTCVTLHRSDDASNSCIWVGTASSCVRLENKKGKYMYITMPNYPKNRQADVGLASGAGLDHNDVTVQAIVRLGCTATFYDRTAGGPITPNVMLGGPKKYGSYVIPSIENGMLKTKVEGLSRVVCSCV